MYSRDFVVFAASAVLHKNLSFLCICRKIVDVAIYALYLESFCGKDLAVRKVFAFSVLQKWESAI